MQPLRRRTRLIAMKRAHFARVAACSAFLFTAGCTTATLDDPGSPAPSSPSAAGTAPSATCHVTEPTRRGVPADVAKQWDGNVFGHGPLWVGAWWTDPDNLAQVRSKGLADDQYPYREKYPSWTVQHGKVSAEAGAPHVRVKRVNAPGQGDGSVGGYASDMQEDTTISHWWPTVVGFSDTGCWQVIETVGADSITYVVQI